MNLSAPFILRPVMTTLVMIAVVVAGIAGYKKIAVSNLPDVNYPAITVKVSFPGTNPETMAKTVATPLENQFMTIPGVKYVTSTNTLGNSNIVITFEIERNVDLAAVDVEAAIVAARPNLPPNLPQDPTFTKVNPSATPIFYLVVTSPTLTAGELYDYANTVIGQRISILEGVSQVNIYGYPSAVRVQVDPGVLASLNLTQTEVASLVGKQNQYQPLGQLDGDFSASTIYDNGGLLKAAEYGSLVVKYVDGETQRLKDVATVVDSLKNDRGSRRYIDKLRDQPNVTLAIQRLPGANTVKVADAIKNLIGTLKKQLPNSLELFVVFDRSLSIRESIADVEITLVLAFTLVVLVIFLYLGNGRDTLIPSLAMPISILATVAIINYLGYTLDNLSLLAIIVAIGFIVDDAIVVLENIVRRVEMGDTPLEASLEGSRQISTTIISMTISLIAVFIPIIFMEGLIGKLFKEFAVTLAVVTLASGLVSLTFTPMLCRLFIPQRSEQHKGRIGEFSERFNKWMLNHYKNGLTWVLHRRKTVLFIGVLSIVGSAILFKILPTDFISNEDLGFIQVFTEAEQGTSSKQMQKYQNELVNILKNEPSILSISSNSSTPVYHQGVIFLNLVPRNQRKEMTVLIKELSEKLKKVPGINVYFKVVPLIDLNIGSQIRGDYQYLMQGLDAQKLYAAAEDLLAKMRKDPLFEGISTDLEIKTPQLNVEIMRDQASALGLDALALEQAFTLGFSGNRISRIQTAIGQYDVIFELARKLQNDASSLDFVYVRSNTSQALIPLKSVVKLSESVGASSVNHFAQFPAVNIAFNIAHGVPLSSAIQRLREYTSSQISGDVIGSVKGTAEVFEESIASMGALVILTIFVIYIILGILYESFIHPLTILSTLPPAIVGGMLTLYITGLPLSLYAYLGLILLIGIVKKNGIMIVDFALDNIQLKGESAEKSIFDACMVRFRPIMMTTMAAILGAVPLAFGLGGSSDSYRPLGLVIIGGMCLSQLITLFLTPVVYLYLEEIRERSGWTLDKHSGRI